MSKNDVSFDELADSLVELGCSNHPSEIHGLLCGQLSAGLRWSESQWLKLVSELSGGKTLSNACKDLANRLYAITVEQLESPDFFLSLLLPDEEEEIQQRTEALGIWCQSFLSGFGEGAVRKPLGDEVEGVLRDFSEIALIQSAVDDSEDAERDLLEISEYVRVALMMVFTEINQQNKGSSEAPEKLH